MAIALIAAGSGGAVGSADGLRRMRKAKRVHEHAASKYKTARTRFKKDQEILEQALIAYGAAKLDAMTGPMTRFVASYQLLEHVDFDPSLLDDETQIDEVAVGGLRELDIGALKTAAETLGAVAVGYAAGAGAGAAASGAVGAFAAAGSGAAISGLSGAAATNATLAWLGGGTLAAGGGGVAAGTMVLTGIGAVPVLLGGGAVLWLRGDKALQNAEANRAEIEETIAKMRAARTRMSRLLNLADRASKVLILLTERLAEATARLEVIVARERDFRQLERHQQEDVARAAKLTQAVRTLVDEPLASDAGNARTSAGRVVAALEDFAYA
ncbi:MAG: hypothetical protein DYH12_03015 [Sorangiineae bacterium PRO1]|nr:hypothetical protein [Sorangiineae bacterium PRO1]